MNSTQIALYINFLIANYSLRFEHAFYDLIPNFSSRAVDIKEEAGDFWRKYKVVDEFRQKRITSK